MAWEPESRAQLDKLRRRGVVAVRYEARGCDVTLELLPDCIGPKNKYVYSPIKGAETRVARNLSDVVRTTPVGASNIASLLKEGDVHTQLELVGSAALPAGTTITDADLLGPTCKRATHVIGAVYVGGFAMAAGRQASATLFRGPPADGMRREGDPRICERADAEGIELPGCSVPLRVGLVALHGNDGGEPAQPVKREAPDLEQLRGAAFDQATVERLVRQRQPNLKRRCWETTASSLRRVTVSVAVVVEPHGRVTGAEPRLVNADGPSDAAARVARCIGGEIETWQFPEPEQQQLVTLPFHFMRQ